ncbi:MAG: N-acetyltransferase [Marmoricola sp.]|jgi:RimJ/RimL family protein N-acetyltransferase|nr:N-acetyltransferase [Marmoricola sp.]
MHPTVVDTDVFPPLWHPVAMTADPSDVVAETARLRIRPWRLEEAPRLLDIHRRVAVVKWLDDGEPKLMKDLAEAQGRIEDYREWSASPPRGFWAIEVRETGRVAGSVLIVDVPNAENDEVQVGWHLHPDSWGQGYAAEAAAAVITYGLDHGLRQILALTHLDNHPSQALARRIGMERLGITEQWYETPSEVFRAAAGTWRPRDS